MNDFLEDLRQKVVDEIMPEGISIIDNSHLHFKHKTFVKDKFHIKLIIKSEKLRQMNKVQAHKKIFSILSDEIKNKIHALEIKIL